jgi:hypothetical protein
MNSDEPQIQASDPEPVPPIEASDSLEPSVLIELAQLSDQETATEVSEVDEIQPQMSAVTSDKDTAEEIGDRVVELLRQEHDLRQQVETLQATYKDLQAQVIETQAALGRLIPEALSELEQRKQALQISVEQLERRRDRIREEMRRSFAGVSQELAIRVQGFKDYLVGSLQDLAVAAEQLELPTVQEIPSPAPKAAQEPEKATNPKFSEQGFQATAKQIRSILDQYRNLPDYYGPPWQLRRTFEPVHAERVSNWFFTQGGRGAIRTMGSRLQNILITSAVISVLRTLYGDRLRTLVLANTPERLGEWRRGLQDCLGISRSDFGPERGLVLFEAAEPLVLKAERLMNEGQMPLIMIDETENLINLALLQFPLWLAFASDPQQMQMSSDFRF